MVCPLVQFNTFNILLYSDARHRLKLPNYRMQLTFAYIKINVLFNTSHVLRFLLKKTGLNPTYLTLTFSICKTE